MQLMEWHVSRVLKIILFLFEIMNLAMLPLLVMLSQIIQHLESTSIHTLKKIEQNFMIHIKIKQSVLDVQLQ